MHSTTERPSRRGDSNHEGRTLTPRFRPRLEAVGKAKCRFLKDHYEVRGKIGEGTYGQVRDVTLMTGLSGGISEE